MGVKKGAFKPSPFPERIETKLKGNLRTALYLYMEDNETTASETLKGGIRVLCRRQLDEIKQGRKPI